MTAKKKTPEPEPISFEREEIEEAPMAMFYKTKDDSLSAECNPAGDHFAFFQGESLALEVQTLEEVRRMGAFLLMVWEKEAKRDGPEDIT